MARIECPHCGNNITLTAGKAGDEIEMTDGPLFGVIAEVAHRYGITVDEIRSRSRMDYLVNARGDVAAELRDRGLSYNHIGALLGGRDHSSIMNVIERRKRRISDCG